MVAKRRSSSDKSNESNKVQKTHARVVISQSIEEPLRESVKEPVEEPVEESVEESVEEPVTSAPVSAIAARRAAAAAGLYTPEPAPEPDMEEEEEFENDPEGIDVQSVGDAEDDRYRDEQALDEDRVMSPISGAATPMKKIDENEDQLMETLQRKLKNKIPHLLDHESVSRFVPNSRNCTVINQEDDTYMFLGLKPGERILFMGQVMVAPLFGAVSVLGAVLSSGRQISTKVQELQVSFYPVFSPRTHALLSIDSQPLTKASCKPHKETTEIDENLIAAVFEDLGEELDQFESMVIIKDLEGSGIESIGNAVDSVKKPLVRFTRKEFQADKAAKINYFPGFQPILEPTPGIKGFQIDASWEMRANVALENASKREGPVVSVVCGAKDMGKSSFCRYLVNRLLTKYNRVAYIESDLGQSEFTPSGLVSLHYITNPILGPPYTHQQLEAERSFFFGSNSPRSNPNYYIACLNALVDHWRHDQEQVREKDEREWIPVVMNTQGWVSGEGYNLLISQIRKIEPTDIFAMRHPMLEYKNLPQTFEADIIPMSREAFVVVKEAPVLHYVSCVLHDANCHRLADKFTALQHRELALGAYFHQSGMGTKHHLLPHWDFNKHMVDRVPYIIDWRQSLNAVWVTYEEVKLSELFYTLNGSLVGLIGDVEDYQQKKGPHHAITNDSFTPPRYLSTENQLAPSPHEITCYGLAIIRAIDPSRHAFLILTPVPKSTLTKVSGIMKGEMRLPLWTMLDKQLDKSDGVADTPWKKVPYITKENTEGVGATVLRVRRTLLRAV